MSLCIVVGIVNQKVKKPVSDKVVSGRPDIEFLGL